MPCGVLWLLTVFDLLDLRKQKGNYIPWGCLSATKVILTCLLISISCLDIGLAMQVLRKVHNSVFPVHFVTPGIRILSFLITIMLMLIHRRKGVQSSGSLFIFWGLLLLASFPQLRTVLRQSETKRLLWRDYKVASYLVYFSCVSVMFLLNCVSDKESENFVPKKNQSPEKCASFPRKMIFQWFDIFMLRGVKRPVDVETVWDLNDDDLTSTLNSNFDIFWEKCLDKRNDSTKNTVQRSEIFDLIWALYKTAGRPVWTTAILRLALVGLSLTSPQILG